MTAWFDPKSNIQQQYESWMINSIQVKSKMKINSTFDEMENDNSTSFLDTQRTFYIGMFIVRLIFKFV